MKEYDVIIVGTGSAMNLVDPIIQANPEVKIAVIDKDEPGGICLTRGCIPSKILLYPAELMRSLDDAEVFGITATLSVDFAHVMNRMRTLIDGDIERIRQGLMSSPNIDYYPSTAEFVSPYTMKVAGETIRGKKIFLCIGSQPTIPAIKGLDDIDYLTSDTILRLKELPSSLIVIGGGYIAAEYGHFFATMGSKVTILGRNTRLLPEEEPEVSRVVRRALERHMTIVTSAEVCEVRRDATGDGGAVVVVTRDGASGKQMEFRGEAVLVASGRQTTAPLIHPERAGIEVDSLGWIKVNEYLEASQPNVWVIGDADGRFLFKHVANYESEVVYYNAVLNQRVKVDYHAVPHAVFTWPEVAAVGLTERQALESSADPDDMLIGFYQYENTAKGEAMNAKEYFVKVIVQGGTMKILGAHIVGPHASVLIQEIVNVMYSPGESAETVNKAMHIHPALNEVVERAFLALYPIAQYHHMLMHAGLEEGDDGHDH